MRKTKPRIVLYIYTTKRTKYLVELEALKKEKSTSRFVEDLLLKEVGKGAGSPKSSRPNC